MKFDEVQDATHTRRCYLTATRTSAPVMAKAGEYICDPCKRRPTPSGPTMNEWLDLATPHTRRGLLIQEIGE